MVSQALFRYAAVPAFAASVALAGRTGTSDPGASGASSTSAGVVTSAPVTSAPVTSSPAGAAWPEGTPEAAKAHTPAGAIAYARFFNDRFNLAWTTADASALKGLGVAECMACKSAIEGAAALAKANMHYSVGPSRVSNYRAQPDTPDGHMLLLYTMEQWGDTIVDKSGVVRSTDKVVIRRDARASLVWRDGRWFIYDLG